MCIVMFFSIRIIGLFLIAAGGWMIYILLTAQPTAEELLERLPDYDHTAAARRLMAEKRYGEAKVLCRDIIDNDLPGKKSAGIIIQMCDEKLHSVKIRLLRTAEAFITGNPGESIEQAGAAVVSDMMMYGDIRDLVMQGYFKVAGKETDPYVAAFAAAGLISEFVDAVDWLPSLFKALRRAGAVPDKMARQIIGILRKSAVNSGPAVKLCGNMKDIFTQGGFLRTKNIFKNLDHADDIAAAAKVMRKAPGAAHLVSRSAGKNTAEVFRKLAAEKKSPAFLRKLLCKGPNGVTLFLRASKSVQKGNAETLVSHLLKSVGAGYRWLVPLGLIGVGILLNLKYILCFKRFFRKFRGDLNGSGNGEGAL